MTTIINRLSASTLKPLSALILVTLLCSCASIQEQKPDTELAPGLARLKMEYPTRRPHLFKERLFGRIISLKPVGGAEEFNNAAQVVRYQDIAPGTYEVKAECEPVIDYNEYPEIWMLNHRFSVQAGQTLTLKCERYTVKKSHRSSNDGLRGQRAFAVRFIEHIDEP